MSSFSSLASNSHTGDPPRGGSPVVVSGISKTYRTKGGGVQALDDVSIEVQQGEIVVLLGPSGCGKTTLLRCIAGLERPDQGEIKIHGRTVYSAEARAWAPPEKRGIAMVFQSYALWPHMTVFENVAYPLKNRRLQPEDIRQRVRDGLAMVRLDSIESAYPGRLSGGQQQRVALARAIVANEGVILFDEPLSNVDARVRERVRLELLDLQRDLQFSAIYVTHDQAEASAIADRIAVMSNARIAQVGPPRDIYERPASRYVGDFMGSANEVTGTLTDYVGGLWTVDTTLGPVYADPHRREFARGQQVTVLFRPEHCQLRSSSSQAEANTWSCTIERSLFLGSHTEYVLSCGDHRFIHRNMSPVAPSSDQWFVHVPPEFAWIIPEV